MPRIGDLLLSMARDPEDHRPLKNLPDRELLAWVVDGGEGNPHCSHARAARHELWYRLRETGLFWIAGKCPNDAIAVLDVAWIFCIEDAGQFGKDAEGNAHDFYFTRIYRAIGRTRPKKGAEVMEGVDRQDFDADEPHDILEQKEIQTAVLEEIQALPELQRQCLLARIMNGQYQKDIARDLGLTAARVGVMIKAAIETLHRRLSQRGFNVPLVLIGGLVAVSVPVHAAEDRLERLLNAGPSLVTGEPIPADALSPVTRALYFGKESVTAMAARPGWIVGGMSAITLPILAGWVLWSFTLLPQPATVQAANAIETKQALPKLQPVLTPVEPVVPVKPSRPRWFPADPQPGQIHAVEMLNGEVRIEFCFVPRPDSQSPGFWMTRTEFTQAQFQRFGFQTAGGGMIDNPSVFVGDDYPLENITPRESAEFVQQVSEKTGIPFRLPTADEWSAAAAAGQSRAAWKRPTAAELDGIAWFQDNASGQTAPVATKQPNAYNFYDLYGNVFEISQSTTGKFQIHGGCWCYDPTWCQPASYSLWDADTRSSLGFRLVHQPTIE